MRALLMEWPRMPGPVIAARIGWPYSEGPSKRLLARISPEYVGIDPVDRVSYEPGQIAQCDLRFPESPVRVTAGQVRILPVLVVTLAFSLFLSATMIPSHQAGDILSGMRQLVAALGRVPTTVVRDRESSIGGTGRVSAPTVAFAATLATTIRLTPPRDPEFKGMVERNHGFLETSFLPGRAFAGPDDLNDQLAAWLPGADYRIVVRALQARPVDLLETDRQAMTVSRSRGWSFLSRWPGRGRTARSTVTYRHPGPTTTARTARDRTQDVAVPSTTREAPRSVTRPISPADAYRLLAHNVQTVIQGKPEVVRLAVVALFAEGHLLIEDVPGLGKTSLARSLARSIGGRWSRIQFTPDLLPGDITGVMVYHQDSAEFRFHPGGIFANVVLADEINRGTPKTQSALLEVMAERKVTVDSVQHAVPRPFLVVATQNPIELDGTYRLPEAQLDRFLMRLSVGYPDHDAEVRVVEGDAAGTDPDRLEPVIGLAQLEAVIAAVQQLHVHREVTSYAVRIAAGTRDHPAVRFGASPRGSVALIRAARALAAVDGRHFVSPDDVKVVAPAVIEHRLVLTPEAELARRPVSGVLDDVLAATPVPMAAGR